MLGWTLLLWEEGEADPPGPSGALACPHCYSVMDRTEMPETSWVACSCCFLESGKRVMEKDKTQPLI